MEWQKDCKQYGIQAIMCKVKHNDNVDKTTITALWEMRSTRKPFQLLSLCWVSPQGGHTLPNPQHTVLSLSLSVFTSTYPLLCWPTLKQEQRARYWKTSLMLDSVYSPGDLFNLRKSQRSSECRFSGKAFSDSTSSQHDDRTSERQKWLANWSPRENKKWKYTHYMT